LKEAALLGCAIPTGAGIVMNTAQLAAERSIAIFGMGGIGQAALLAAKMRGAAAIIAVDVSADKLARAAALGATHTVNAAVEDVGQSIKKITQNRGVDYALECAGQIESMEAGYRCVREKGGLCIIAGNLSSGQTIRIDPFDLIKGKRILGTWGGETQPDRDIPLYADMALSGKLDLDQLIGCVFPLDRINDALGYMEKSSTGRVMIEMSV
ncbi:MAG: zinc-binding dehydrogenase, partial [Candidatus Omnitrophota bacterium]